MRAKQTFWTEDEFTVTVSSGIRKRDVRVAEIVVIAPSWLTCDFIEWMKVSQV
jgi:hypothetical protein